MFVSSPYRITGLHYTYGYATFSGAYFCKLYIQTHLMTLHLWVCHLKCSLIFLEVFVQKHWVKLQLWVSQLKCSLCLKAVNTESLRYTSLMAF